MRVVLAAVCLLMGGAYMQLVDWYPDVSWIQGAPLAWIWPLLVSIGSGCLIFLVPRFLARDPLLSAWAILGSAGCLLLLPLILSQSHQSRHDLTERVALLETREALRLDQARRAKEQEAQMKDRRERSKTDRFVQYEGKIPDGMLATLRDLDARMQEELATNAEAYAKALEVNPTLGPEAWIRFRTLDELEIELAAHKRLYEQTRAFTYFIESFEDRYMAAAEALKLQPPADRIAVAEMERILQLWEQSGVYDLRKLDVRLLGSSIAALNILRDAWGAWSYNLREKTMDFEDPALEAAFRDKIQLAQAIAIEVQSIREAMDSSESDF